MPGWPVRHPVSVPLPAGMAQPAFALRAARPRYPVLVMQERLAAVTDASSRRTIIIAAIGSPGAAYGCYGN